MSSALAGQMLAVVITAVANTIVRRIALVPLRNYPYFLTQLQTLTYVILYTTILWQRRYRLGIVTSEMLQIPKAPFVWIGLCDGLGDVLGNVGTSRLPGYQVPLLAKLNIVFTAIFSHRLLHKHYSVGQLVARSVVLLGSVVTLWPSLVLLSENATEETGNDDTTTQLWYALVYIASVAPTALAFVLKERIFAQHNVDIFVVNTYSSWFGLVTTLGLLPLATLPGLGSDSNVTLTALPQYMVHGWHCFWNDGRLENNDTDCTGSPFAPLLYLILNVAYNICFLSLIKHGGALLTFLTNTVTFPISTILFTFSWPLLGPTHLNGYVFCGLGVELTGILAYRWASSSIDNETGKPFGNHHQDGKTSPIPALENPTPLLLEGMPRSSSTATNTRYGATDENSPAAALRDDDVKSFCYNRLLRKSLQKHCGMAEDLCKSLLSPKCQCG